MKFCKEGRVAAIADFRKGSINYLALFKSDFEGFFGVVYIAYFDFKFFICW